MLTPLRADKKKCGKLPDTEYYNTRKIGRPHIKLVDVVLTKRIEIIKCPLTTKTNK